MPQLVPFYFISQIAFAFGILVLLIYAFSKFIFPRCLRLYKLLISLGPGLVLALIIFFVLKVTMKFFSTFAGALWLAAGVTLFISWLTSSILSFHKNSRFPTYNENIIFLIIFISFYCLSLLTNNYIDLMFLSGLVVYCYDGYGYTGNIPENWRVPVVIEENAGDNRVGRSRNERRVRFPRNPVTSTQPPLQPSSTRLPGINQMLEPTRGRSRSPILREATAFRERSPILREATAFRERSSNIAGSSATASNSAGARYNYNYPHDVLPRGVYFNNVLQYYLDTTERPIDLVEEAFRSWLDARRSIEHIPYVSPPIYPVHDIKGKLGRAFAHFSDGSGPAHTPLERDIELLFYRYNRDVAHNLPQRNINPDVLNPTIDQSPSYITYLNGTIILDTSSPITLAKSMYDHVNILYFGYIDSGEVIPGQLCKLHVKNAGMKIDSRAFNMILQYTAANDFGVFRHVYEHGLEATLWEGGVYRDNTPIPSEINVRIFDSLDPTRKYLT